MAETWSYSEGQYGYKVRVFERLGRTKLYISTWDIERKKEVVRSLGYADRERAIQECRLVSDALRLGFSTWSHVGLASGPAEESTSVSRATQPSGGTANSGHGADADEEGITWDDLFAFYHERRGRHKKGTQPSEDLRRQKVWKAFFREQEIAGPDMLDQDDVDTFIRLRREGSLAVPGVAIQGRNPERPDQDAVAPRTIEADIVYLTSVLNWAAKKRKGRRLIDESPIRLPENLKSPEPHRPVATYEDLRDLRKVADDVDPQRLYGCFVRLQDALGWRVTAVCNITASEVCLAPMDGMPYGFVRKNPKVDKIGVGQKVPLSRHAQATLKRLLRVRGIREGGDTFLFPSPKDSRRPWSRWHERDLRKRAEKKAGISIGGSHAVRRKWVSERKDHPIPDIMRAGGWTKPESLGPYLQDDVDTTFQVVSRPTRRIRRRGDTS